MAALQSPSIYYHCATAQVLPVSVLMYRPPDMTDTAMTEPVCDAAVKSFVKHMGKVLGLVQVARGLSQSLRARVQVSPKLLEV